MPVHGSISERAKPQALIFDVDGTLIDTLQPMRQALNEVLAQAGIPVWTEQEVTAHLSLGLDGMLALALRAKGRTPPDASEQEARTALLQRYSELAPTHAQCYPGAQTLLRQARADGYRLAVCSNSSGLVLHRLFAVLGWHGLFEVVVHAGNALALKPSGLPLRQVLTMLALPPGKAWLIGDSALDAACAHAAGCRFVWVSGGYAKARPTTASVQVDELAAVATLLRQPAQ
jgi:phosphoglycolate phosphatase